MDEINGVQNKIFEVEAIATCIAVAIEFTGLYYFISRIHFIGSVA